ncbi:hypothetical protein OBBRIDRAFT_799429 [Obba rivulosa]|uniref:Uncharacterized protein n=1 Tax=Obba rivulosa TaxID=1052685 RepID=A0A8E2AL83_9APHY|nr:hypothetical protein OBBRIDRAFT_799429 [Obba rivulosa]
MEKIRRKLAQDPALYPGAAPTKAQPRASQPARPVSPIQTVISIASTASDVTPPQPKVVRRVIELSDSEDEIEVLGGPLRDHINSQIPVVPLSGATIYHKTAAPVPIHPAYQPAPRNTEPEYETFDVPEVDNVYETRLSPQEAEKALRDLVSATYDHDDQEISMEDAVVDGFHEGVRLLPHQVIGRKWMADRESGKKAGGILADDMGLGKTIQTITRIVEGRPTKKDSKAGWAPSTLVVCPVAVVGQWASEIKKIALRLNVIEHHGPSRTSDPAVLERAHVVITSYSTVASEYGTFSGSAKDESKSKSKSKNADNPDDDSDSSKVIGRTIKKRSSAKKKDALFHVKWWRIVLDEAHNIKNRNTKSAQACFNLNGHFRWCLTGTPMQNNVEELFSLLHFLTIRPLNDWATFKTQIAQPVKAGKTVRAMKRLQVVLGSVMLRRTKDTLVNGKPILQLPERNVQIVECEFDAAERAFYDSVAEKINDRLKKLQQQGEMTKNYTGVLVLLLRLRQACNHPSLVSGDYKKDKEAVEPRAAKNDDDDADDLADALAGMGLSQIKRCQLCQEELTSDNTGEDGACLGCTDIAANARRKSLNPSSGLPPDSTKIRKILELLDDIETRSEATEKTIIFSQFTSMLDIIEPFLRAEGIKFVRYDGSMSKIERDAALEKIRSSSSTRVILISFKAGSTGLNLTCCNNVILVDLWWNPALEDQAFDRAHRFGQKRDVHIHKLCVPNTVEGRILELQGKKKALANAALAGDKLKNMRLGLDELVALFRPGGDHDDEE